MQLNIGTVIPVTAIISYVLLLVIVLLSRPQNVMRSRFRLYLICMLVWSVAALIVMRDFGNTLFWFRFMTSSALASMTALFYFTQSVVIKKFRFANLIYLYGIAAILINQFTSTVTPYAEIVNGELSYEMNPLVALVAGPSYLVMLFAAFQLIWNTRATKDETQYARFVLLAVAIVFVLIGGSFNFTSLGKYPISTAR